MATKEYSKEIFNFINSQGVDDSICCYTTETRNGFCHHAQSFINGELKKTRVSYYNRTWERFKYETVIKRHIEKYPSSERVDIHAQLISKTC